MKDNTKQAVAKEPFVRIAARKGDSCKPLNAFAIRAAALVGALLVCGLFIRLAANISVFEAFAAMLKGTFGQFGNTTSMKIKCWDSAIYAARLLCISVALAPAFKMRFWNIGAEGQIVMGALITAIVMRDCTSLPSPLLYTLMILGCIAGGAIWGIVPAVFKAKWGTNETLFTLMMNYVAMKIMDFFYNDWKGLNSALEKINSKTKIGYLPEIFGHGYTINIIVFVLLAVIVFFYLKKTKQGYEIAVVGESNNTARYAGINVTKVMIRTMAISGAICGLCGGLTVAGQIQTIAYSGELSNAVTNGYGFTAIIVAWLAKFNTLGMIGISMLIVFLEKGTAQLGNTYSALSVGAGNVLIGIVLFFIIGSEFFIRYRLIFREKAKKEAC